MILADTICCKNMVIEEILLRVPIGELQFKLMDRVWTSGNFFLSLAHIENDMFV